MGIRVHKSLGYGIDDLLLDEKERPCDPRWDYEKFRQTKDYERSLSDLLAWIEDETNASRVLELADHEGWDGGSTRQPGFKSSTQLFLFKENLKDRIQKKVYWCTSLRYTGEGGLPNALLIEDPGRSDWYRWDDIIDYYEEEPEGRATKLRRTGIYPYDGVVKRYRLSTPEVAAKLSEQSRLLQAYSLPKFRETDGAEIDLMSAGEFNELIGWWDPKLKALIEDPEVLRHLMEDWRPRIPLPILAYMEYLGCFPDPLNEGSMLNSLRPMIYVWWC